MKNWINVFGLGNIAYLGIDNLHTFILFCREKQSGHDVVRGRSVITFTQRGEGRSIRGKLLRLEVYIMRRKGFRLMCKTRMRATQGCVRTESMAPNSSQHIIMKIND